MKSCEFLFNLTFIHEQFGISDLNILSIHNRTVLISGQWSKKLYIYNFEGQLLSSINTSDEYCLQDAVWTSRGNILFIVADYPRRVVTMSAFGIVINRSQAFKNLVVKLSHSSDGVIYLIDELDGVHQSSNDGISWSFIFKPIENWFSQQVIKVTTDNSSENFWSMEKNCPNNTYCITSVRIYKVYKNKQEKNWKDVSLLTPTGIYINLTPLDLGMHYDGVSSILLSEWSSRVIHVFSVTGQYHSQLLSTDRVVLCPYSIVADKEQNVIFVGQRYLVTAFKLNYEEKVYARN